MRSLILTVAVLIACLLACAPADAADRPATPATFAVVWAAAQPGDTILLASGSYGQWDAGTSTKSGVVTIRPQAGATPTMALHLFPEDRNIRLEGVTVTGGSIQGARNVTLTGTKHTGYLLVYATTNVDHGIVLDGTSWGAINYSGGFEGRLSIRGNGGNTVPVGVTVKNSTFGPGGCSDGIQLVGQPKGVQILGNTFTGLVQGSCGPHVDGIQEYTASDTVIRGNYFTGTDVGVGIYDGGTREIIEDNVFVGRGPQVVQLGAIQSGTFLHNTIRNGTVSIAGKSQNGPTRNEIIRDNVFANSSLTTSFEAGCSGCQIVNNLMSGAQFVGGSSPASYAGHRLALGSPGTGDATDGGDRGIRVAGAPDPEPTPTPTPSATPTPTPTPSATPSPEPTPTPEPGYDPACRPGCDQVITDLRTENARLADERAQARDDLVAARAAQVAAEVARDQAVTQRDIAIAEADAFREKANRYDDAQRAWSDRQAARRALRAALE